MTPSLRGPFRGSPLEGVKLVKTRAMIRHPLLAASLGAAVVALPASALYLYGSGHTAKAAGTSAVVASAPAPNTAPVVKTAAA